MKQAIAKKWVAALRSGEYQQGEGQLRTEDNEFCCLGVLCNLHAQANPRFAMMQDDPTEYGGQSDVAPEVVLEWSGLEDSMGEFIGKIGKVVGYTGLAAMNDNGRSFLEIADVIEKHWRSL